MIFFTSDLHFNHRNILEYSHRPFPDLATMHRSLIVNWNSVVKPEDTVWVLGDFGFHAKGEGCENLAGLFDRLAGHKHLVKGNHDEKNPKVMKLPWASVSDLVTLRVGESRFVCCHYPLESWKNAHKGYLHLHGHCHGSLKRVIPHRFDVGVDVEGYYPVTWESLALRAGQQAFDPQDHHA
jgi:calcineurin-like phosphoesterase family protein